MGIQALHQFETRESNCAIAATSECPLTNREVEILRLMGDGLTTKAIAARLNIAFKTAACHRSRVLQKLSVQSTVSAVRWAIKQGIVTL